MDRCISGCICYRARIVRRLWPSVALQNDLHEAHKWSPNAPSPWNATLFGAFRRSTEPTTGLLYAVFTLPVENCVVMMPLICADPVEKNKWKGLSLREWNYTSISYQTPQQKMHYTTIHIKWLWYTKIIEEEYIYMWQTRMYSNTLLRFAAQAVCQRPVNKRSINWSA